MLLILLVSRKQKGFVDKYVRKKENILDSGIMFREANGCWSRKPLLQSNYGWSLHSIGVLIMSGSWRSLAVTLGSGYTW